MIINKFCCKSAYKLIKYKHKSNKSWGDILNYMEIIENKIKENHGIITNRELAKNNIPTIYLHRMVKNGKLSRVDRGVYISKEGDYDEYYFFSNRYDVPIFSYRSSLYLHDVTDFIPQKMEVTVYRGYNAHRIDKNVIVHYVSKDIYELGITKVKTKYGNMVKAYNKERTFCDFVKSRKEIDSELFSKTINNYIKDKNKDLNKLYTYAKKMKIEREVSEIIEVIYE